MSAENPYETVLADLKAKRAALDSAIAAMESVMAQGGAPISAGIPSQPNRETEIRPDSFFGMSIPDAAKKFLAMSNRNPKSTQQIADALQSGGMTSDSDNFANSVGSVLNRVDRLGGDIVKISRGMWGLVEWYPGRKRNSKKQIDDSNDVSGLVGDKTD